jgi:hypothetical protein
MLCGFGYLQNFLNTVLCVEFFCAILQHALFSPQNEAPYLRYVWYLYNFLSQYGMRILIDRYLSRQKEKYKFNSRS